MLFHEPCFVFSFLGPPTNHPTNCNERTNQRTNDLTNRRTNKTTCDDGDRKADGGSLLCTSYRSREPGVVSRFTASGEYAGVALSSKYLAGPSAVAVLPDRSALVASYDTNGILLFNMSDDGARATRELVLRATGSMRKRQERQRRRRAEYGGGAEAGDSLSQQQDWDRPPPQRKTKKSKKKKEATAAPTTTTTKGQKKRHAQSI